MPLQIQDTKTGKTLKLNEAIQQVPNALELKRIVQRNFPSYKNHMHFDLTYSFQGEECEIETEFDEFMNLYSKGMVKKLQLKPTEIQFDIVHEQRVEEDNS